ncbi:hypothetical protein EXIGLDRAFT_833184 [Exidia glandulosa HHB12029]|uniref:Uncharacterized protein n=1 Tax=Exidia glandulosa HHB12029 TaxID=1314781 RepID=A0A165KXX2_EXIGL|nr:hypothetical protein EXIGLDRAFT_833184 [Exidia glandulosa HHB12029]
MALLDPRPRSRTWSLECIRLILGHLLNVPEQRFASLDLDEFNDRQLAALSTRGVSWDPWRLLLVCKLWREVGEPLLYYTVVVRSQAQAQTLADTFREHPALARHVRQLRLEGLYGHAGAYVLHCTAATVLDIWLEESGYNSARNTGDIAQAAALSWLNPRKAILHKEKGYYYGRIDSTPAYVAQAVARWSRLEYVNWVFGFSSEHKQERAIAVAIGTLPNLNVIAIPTRCTPKLEALKLAAISPALRRVIAHGHVTVEMMVWFASNVPSVALEGGPWSSYWSYARKELQSAVCTAIFSDDPPPDSKFKRQEDDVPIVHTKQLPGEVLDVVIGMALQPAPDDKYQDATDCRAWYDQRRSHRLLQVSRQVRELTLTYLVQRPYFGSIRNMVSFTNFMLTRPDLVHRVAALEFGQIGTRTREDSEDFWNKDRDPAEKAISNVYALTLCVTSLRNIRRIKVGSIASERVLDLSPSLLEALGTFLQLEELSGVSIGWNPSHGYRAGRLTSQCLARFRSLRILDNAMWSSTPVLSENVPWCSVFNALQTLEFRHESQRNVISELWKALALMELPLLTSFGYPDIDLAQATPFFEKHGMKLERIVLNICRSNNSAISLETLCPNVIELEFGEETNVDGYLSVQHHGVLRIIVNEWEHHLYGLAGWWRKWIENRDGGISLPPFPALKEIHTRRVNPWSSGGRDWRALADDMRVEGVIMLSARGEAWRSRLRRPGPKPVVIPDPALDAPASHPWELLRESGDGNDGVNYVVDADGDDSDVEQDYDRFTESDAASDDPLS